MKTPRRTTAIILTGAVALASGAYAIGTQVGGGSADARGGDSDGRRFMFGPGEPFAGLADALGVDEDELREALDDFRSEHRSERKGAFEAALADALGKSTEEVERAFEELHNSERAAFAGRLAKALDLDTGKVEAALQKVRDRARKDGVHGPRDFVDDLAAELGVRADRLEDALREVRPLGPGPGCAGPGPRESGLRDLATALDVTPSELRAALRQIWDDRGTVRPDGHGELAEFLAQRFNLSVERVEEALDDSLPPPPNFRRGPGPGFGPPAWHG
jgi:hypothetical protein